MKFLFLFLLTCNFVLKFLLLVSVADFEFCFSGMIMLFSLAKEVCIETDFELLYVLFLTGFGGGGLLGVTFVGQRPPRRNPMWVSTGSFCYCPRCNLGDKVHMA